MKRTIDNKQTKLYRKWSSMIRRCNDPGHPAYLFYASRGITVCAQWLGHSGFDCFCLDMGEPPDGLTLDRIDNSKGYDPSNCRWATWKEQAANRRPKTCDPNSLNQKAKRAGLRPLLVWNRINKLGWTEELALATLPRAKMGRLRRMAINPDRRLGD